MPHTKVTSDVLETPLPYVAGQVLQVVTATDAGTTTSSTSHANLNASSVPITPKSAASSLLVECSFYGGIGSLAATNTSGTFQIYDATNAVLVGSAGVIIASSGAGGTGSQAPCSIRAIVANAVLTARSFTLRGFTSNASAAAFAYNHVWSITEIKT
jgi:hypothetical protein